MVKLKYPYPEIAKSNIRAKIFNFFGIIPLDAAILFNTLSPDEENASTLMFSFFSALLSNKVLIAGTNVITRKKAKNIPAETRIPKSFNSGRGETIFVKNPTIVARVASVSAIPTDFSVEVAEPLTVFPDPISSLYLEVK